jgi:peptidoglycan/LPS O-acetylase OafA/YrhL
MLMSRCHITANLPLSLLSLYVSQNGGSKHYFWGDELIFAAIGFTLLVADIYRRVQHEDRLEFWRNNTDTDV